MRLGVKAWLIKPLKSAKVYFETFRSTVFEVLVKEKISKELKVNI